MSRIHVLRPEALRLVAPLLLVAGLLGAAATSAGAQALTVRIRSDRGDGAVYEPGNSIGIDVRTNLDAYVVVYEIDAVGAIHLLYPNRGQTPDIQGGTTLQLPQDSDEQLVVEGPVGEGYVVAVASLDPFRRMPWYLRPENAQAEDMGYTNDDEAAADGVTADGKIVGDPYVAMERIRRSLLADPANRGSFATAYTSYYVHHEVRYPRYLCNDCHRPGHWAWWDGFDPYYSSCSVFEFRINSNWWWGPTYWNGYVPYYAFVFRDNCPPRYRPHGPGGNWCSSWDGWRRWGDLWGGPLRRYKTPPPPGYVGPDRFARMSVERGANRPMPPGFLASAHDVRTSPSIPGTGIRRERIGNGGGSGSPAGVGRQSPMPGGDRPVRGGSDRGWRMGDARLPETGRARPSEGVRQVPRDGEARDRGSRPERGSGSGAQRPEAPAREDRGSSNPRRYEAPPERTRDSAPPPERAPDRGSQRPERPPNVSPPQSDAPPRNAPPPSNPPPDRPQRTLDSGRNWGARGRGN